MMNIVIKVNSNPDLKSLLECLTENERYYPQFPNSNGIYTNISTDRIKNISDDLYPNITVRDFITIHEDALRVLPAFKFSQAMNQWFFELSVKDFIKLRKWEIKRYFEARMLFKYPIWKQLNLTNDKEYALIQLTKNCPLGECDIMKTIQEVLPINSNTKLPDLKNFEKSLPNMDFKLFAVLKPNTYKVADIEILVRPILQYLIYYYTSCRIRQVVTNEEKKLDVCSTFEAVSAFVPVDPAL